MTISQYLGNFLPATGEQKGKEKTIIIMIIKKPQKDREIARFPFHNYAEIWPKLNMLLVLYVGRGERIEKDWLF